MVIEPISWSNLRGIEREVRRFLECGWILEYHKQNQEYLLKNPLRGDEVYSSLELNLETEIFTEYDFSKISEREGAKRILEFIVAHEDLVQSEMNPYRKNITYFD